MGNGRNGGAITVKIIIMVEGETEKVFLPFLRGFLQNRLNNMPKLKPSVFDGAVPTGAKLKRAVENYFSGKEPADHVIWLTDVYPGKGIWTTAEEAKQKAREWVGPEDRFHPHVALHDFEAWLLPYWDRIKKLAKTERTAPSGKPESVNHMKPPAYHIKEAYHVGKCRKDYKKPIDAPKILKDQDLMISINACPELKALVNTILEISGGDKIL